MSNCNQRKTEKIIVFFRIIIIIINRSFTLLCFHTRCTNTCACMWVFVCMVFYCYACICRLFAYVIHFICVYCLRWSSFNSHTTHQVNHRSTNIYSLTPIHTLFLYFISETLFNRDVYAIHRRLLVWHQKNLNTSALFRLIDMHKFYRENTDMKMEMMKEFGYGEASSLRAQFTVFQTDLTSRFNRQM